MTQGIPDALRVFEPFWDHWTITAHIDEGGYGNVYRITRTDIPADSSVANAALKWISIPKNESEMDDMAMKGMSEESIRRLNRAQRDVCLSEIELMGRFKGRGGIVSYEDFFVHEREGGRGYDIFIRMELMKETLYQRLKRERVGEKDAAQIGLDVLGALIDCHESGVIHRDIKPENIFITFNGSYKLGDFGIAKQLDESGQVIAAASGTSAYAAPEVVSGAAQTPATDVYSLGLILYHLLNDNLPPFASGAPAPEEYAQLQERRLSGEKLKKPANASDGMWSIIKKACEYQPKNRYQSARDMRNALSALVNGGAPAVKSTDGDKPKQGAAAEKPAYEARRAETVTALRKQFSRAGEKPMEDVTPAKGAHPKKKALINIGMALAALGALLLIIYAVKLFTAATPTLESASNNQIELEWRGGGGSKWRVEYAPKGVKAAYKTIDTSERRAELNGLIPDTLYTVNVYDADNLILSRDIATQAVKVYKDERFSQWEIALCSYKPVEGRTFEQVLRGQYYEQLKEDDRYELTLRSVPMDTQETRYFANIKYTYAGERQAFGIEFMTVLRLPGGGAYCVESTGAAQATRIFRLSLDLMPLFDLAYRDMGELTSQLCEVQLYIDGMLAKTFDLEMIVPTMQDD